ncbi:MAG: hypothetical protein A2481_00345 [Candidatus Yonathbacteria bacterium RIFOXYC2_FULL_47_9]|nr:MAG: hypothetical protein A2481_00345 [Candidatus Yonathbacteria bacterium RIFOXYC2_FULL_47_9]HAT68509.1 hypothetical protein [Candidatus Yonathbacteria bacterium]
MTAVQKGFTSIECIALMLCAVPIFMANIYYTERGIAKELKVYCPSVKKVLETERNFFTKSVIVVETYDGVRATYKLDSNMFYQYDLKLQ